MLKRISAVVVLAGCATLSFAEPAPAGPASVAPGKYSCFVFMNGSLQGLANSDFEIKAGGVYVDNDKVKGTYTYDAAQSQVSFKGGSRNGELALFESPAGGRTLLRIYNEKHTRTVIDCEKGK